MARAKNSPAADRRREAFKAFMEAHGLNPHGWAKAAGLENANAIYNFMGGSSASLSQQTLEQLARPIGVQPSAIFGELEPAGGARTLVVVGFVQAGTWSEAVVWSPAEQRRVAIPAMEGSRPSQSYGLIVRGPSMNKIFPDGTLLEVVDLPAYDGTLKNGDKVIVHRQDRHGLWEATCKELQIENGLAWLWPKSTDPAFQQPISVPWPPGEDEAPRADGVEFIEIKAVVLSSIRREV